MEQPKSVAEATETVAPKRKHTFTVEQLFSYLTGPKGKNFYARIISQLERKESMEVPTMAVSIDNFGKYLFLYNPNWFQTACSKEQAVNCVEHECLHLILEHIPRFAELKSNSAVSLHNKLDAAANIGMDEAVNSFLLKERSGLPEGCVLPQKFNHPNGKGMEWYISKLLKTIKEVHVAFVLEGKGSSDGKDEDELSEEIKKKFEKKYGKHMWGKTLKEMDSEQLKDLSSTLERQTKRMVQKAVEEHNKMSSHSRGTIPGGLQSLLDGILKAPIIPWQQIFKQEIQSSINMIKSRYLGRPNRRFQSLGISPFPGKKLDPVFNIAVSIDVSGSMSDEDVMTGLGIVEDIMASNSEIKCTVLEFDAVVNHHYDLGEGKREPDRTRHGYGGTSFDPPFKWVKERSQYDMFICFTDGWAPEPTEDAKLYNIPVLWVLTHRGDDPCKGQYGKVLRLEDF